MLLLHHTEEQRRSGVTAWVRRCLRRGSKIFYTEPADAADRSLRTLLEPYARAQRALDRGQVEVVPASAQAYDPDWQLRKVEDALAAGYPRVDWSAEAATAWTVMSRDEHLELERGADELCRTMPLSFACQYAVEESAETLGPLCAAHRGGLADPLLRAACDGNVVSLVGDVDLSNRTVLTSYLDATTAGLPADPLEVDLSGVDFVDAGGVRALMTGTHRFRRRGGSVRLRDPRRHVARVARLVLCTPAPGFSVESA